MQATVKSAIEFRGFGLHSGRPVRLRILPASVNYGIWFKRVDVDADGSGCVTEAEAVKLASGGLGPGGGAGGGQVLLLKEAWGGKDLDVDYRPPSRNGVDKGVTGWFWKQMNSFGN